MKRWWEILPLKERAVLGLIDFAKIDAAHVAHLLSIDVVDVMKLYADGTSRLGQYRLHEEMREHAA